MKREAPHEQISSKRCSEAMPPSQSMTPHRKRSRRRSRRSAYLVVATVAALAVVASAEEEEDQCQRGSNGWAASSDCKTYYWCSHGVRSSMTYNCVEGQLFEMSKSACSHGYSCSYTTITAAATTAMEPASSGAHTFAAATTDYPNAPTAYPTKLGPAVYYGDFRTTSCQSIDDLVQGQPDWMKMGVTEVQMFQSKEECCKVMFSWAPMANCLGHGFVESNYVIGSRPPTLSPTMSPTSLPSLSPSDSLMPSYAPSRSPSEVPSTTPSMFPTTSGTFAPSTSSSPSLSNAPTSSPTGLVELVDSITQTTNEPKTTTVHQNNDFLVELIGWANADMETLFPEGSTVDMYNPTPSPVRGIDQISELILPVISDATLSQNRPDANFGTNTALAVDGAGGDSSGERFDSLLKFDVSMIDPSRDSQSAVLRIYALSDRLGGTFTTTVDSDWDQEDVTWDTVPSDYGGVLFGVLKEVRQNR